MDPTEKYIKENKHVLSHRKEKIASSSVKNVTGWSLRNLLKIHLKSTLLCAKNYPFALWHGRKLLKRTWGLKNSATKKKALIIGNGPSQGYLDIDYLNSFVQGGGETYCVNYWNLNKNLKNHVPTWMVLSDPKTFNPKTKEPGSLIDYLQKNPSINIVVPSSWAKEIYKTTLKNNIYVFIDAELSICKNISPLFPRGYLSMTLYKALSWAIYLGYPNIGIIGMDNTYPRNIYCDKNNHVLNLETHGGTEDYIIDFSDTYPSVASRLDDLVRLFLHLEYFPQKGIFNLDPYSLTDRFTKIDMSSFLKLRND